MHDLLAVCTFMLHFPASNILRQTSNKITTKITKKNYLLLILGMKLNLEIENNN